MDSNLHSSFVGALGGGVGGGEALIVEKRLGFVRLVVGEDLRDEGGKRRTRLNDVKDAHETWRSTLEVQKCGKRR